MDTIVDIALCMVRWLNEGTISPNRRNGSCKVGVDPDHLEKISKAYLGLDIIRYAHVRTK